MRRIDAFLQPHFGKASSAHLNSALQSRLPPAWDRAVRYESRRWRVTYLSTALNYQKEDTGSRHDQNSRPSFAFFFLTRFTFSRGFLQEWPRMRTGAGSARGRFGGGCAIISSNAFRFCGDVV